MLVTHGADLHAALPLSVPLAEELLHDAVRPLAVELKGLGGVAQIGAVHHVLQHLREAEQEQGFLKMSLLLVHVVCTCDKLHDVVISIEFMFLTV